MVGLKRLSVSSPYLRVWEKNLAPFLLHYRCRAWKTCSGQGGGNLFRTKRGGARLKGLNLSLPSPRVRTKNLAPSLPHHNYMVGKNSHPYLLNKTLDFRLEVYESIYFYFLNLTKLVTIYWLTLIERKKKIQNVRFLDQLDHI